MGCNCHVIVGGENGSIHASKYTDYGTDIYYISMFYIFVFRIFGRCFRDTFSQIVTIDLLPVDPGDKPVKFVGREVPGGVICTWPTEAAFVTATPRVYPSAGFDTYW